MRPRSSLLLACACALLARSAYADDERGPTLSGDRVATAIASTNPLPIVKRLKFSPSYTFEQGDTVYKAALEFQPTLPFNGLLIPGLDIAGVWSVARFQLFGESLQNDNGTASGLENLNAVDLAAYQLADLTVAAGVATVFPMATSPALGPAKWQLGPAAAFYYQPSDLFSIAALAQALWSVAGSNQVSDQSYVTLQPFVTVRLPNGMLFISDAEMKFFWQGGSTTIPVDLGVGYAFSSRFVGIIKGQRTVAGSDEGQWTATLDLVFLP